MEKRQNFRGRSYEAARNEKDYVLQTHQGGEINVTVFGLFGNDRSAHNREAESGNEEVIKMNDEAKKNFEKVITVIGEILEGMLLAITVYFSKKE